MKRALSISLLTLLFLLATGVHLRARASTSGVQAGVQVSEIVPLPSPPIHEAVTRSSGQRATSIYLLRPEMEGP